jgi:hypothetical protein
MSPDRSRTVIFIALGALFLIALCVVVIVVGRLFMQPASVGTQDPNLIYTAAAQTVSAQLTQASGGEGGIPVQPTQTPGSIVLPTNTQVVLPTNTSIPANTAIPTNTAPPPTNTAIPIPCDRAFFVKDITYPDNTEVPVGSTFVKTWRITNNGSCTWTSGYSVVFYSGDAMNGPASTQLTTGTVPPGSSIDISLTLKAPDTAGTYRGDWMLRNSGGALFGIGDRAEKSFWVQIKAYVPVTPTPTVTVGFDFISQGPNAAWRNATQNLVWGDPGDDSKGVAADASNRKLEDNKTYPRTLATFPEKITDGLIRGVYPAYAVKSGDHFRAILGLKEGCDVGRVRYILSYMSGNVEVILGEWVEKCDEKVTLVDIDLSALQGQQLQFVLTVKTEGSPSQDNAYWASPRIER